MLLQQERAGHVALDNHEHKGTKMSKKVSQQPPIMLRMILKQHHRQCRVIHIAYARFFRVRLRRDKVDSLHVAEIDFVAEHLHVEHLPHVLFAIVRVHLASRCKLGANVGHLLVDSLLLLGLGRAWGRGRNAKKVTAVVLRAQMTGKLQIARQGK